MATSDIALEKVQALLKVDAGNGSLYNHMVRVVRSLAAEKPADALAQLETLSRHLKESAFSGAPAPEVAEASVAEKAAEEEQKRCCEQALKLVRQPSDPSAAPKVLGLVQNFLEDSAMFEWAGVGFGRQESYSIAMSLRKLATETPGLESLRLWGKVLGIEGDYYVAEGTLGMPPGAAPQEPAWPGTPDFEVEPSGEGANTCIYWVKSGGFEPWVRLPNARAGHIVASRNIKRLMTGNLSASVESSPWFPGSERHLLRSQIARITATCTLAVKGWYEEDAVPPPGQENPIKNKIKMVEGAVDAFPSPDDLKTEAGWCHASPFLLSTGKSSWPDWEALEALIPEENEAEKEKLGKIKENFESQGLTNDAEPEHAMLEDIAADLEEMKQEDEGSPAWQFKVYGDEGVYASGDATRTPRVFAVRSTIWPGAITVAKGTKFANLYVGYAMKCGSLVGPQKESGLPLRGTCPMLPLEPDAIMDEPKDLEEHEEPNPVQDEAESDKGDVDDEPEE